MFTRIPFSCELLALQTLHRPLEIWLSSIGGGWLSSVPVSSG
ncbi:MAG TPA: hypothetical protein VFG15_03235 [Amycolatopsis sp.]|nr:hypothetical protein [Amycolatopsis sp.]